MHIHGLPNDPSHRAFEIQQKKAADVHSSKEKTVNRNMVRTDAEHAMSFVWLAEELSEIPEVREQVVAQAAERYASGYYLTKEAAELTADRISET